MSMVVSAPSPRVVAAENLRLGVVHFAASGSQEAQPHFQRGIAALHSFWYEEALEAFHRALEIDPGFAMAWWGVAMAYHRPYLPGSDDAAGRRALARIGDPAGLTAREAAYIAALRSYYSEQSSDARTLAYAGAMEKLYRAYPDDDEAAAFFALSLLGYEWSTEEGFARQERAAAVALEVYRRNPNHPGAAHYIIHSLDDPALASRGLEAARQYARIAPDAPHALHMPSHIFLQLGRWTETAASNEAGWAASEQWVQRKQLDPSQRDYHNLHWLIYACLQQGRYARAKELIRAFTNMRDAIAPDGLHFLNDALAAYVIETRNWAEAETLFAATAPKSGGVPRPNSARGVEICGAPTLPATTGAGGADTAAYVRAFAAASSGAPNAEQRLEALREAATINNVMARFWRIRILELTALCRAQAGDAEAALRALREATTIEETFPPPPGPPSSAKPPHELFGEVLLSRDRPAEALAQFNHALTRHPNRALSLLGRARAEAALHDESAARTSYTQFLEVWCDADPNLPELREAREFRAAKSRAE